MSPDVCDPIMGDLWSGVKTGMSSHASIADLIFTYMEVHFSIFILCVCLVFIH